MHTRESTDAAHGRSWLLFIAVAGCMTLATLGANLPSPIYPIYQADFGLSSLEISIAFAAYALALIPALIVAGGLSDAIGRRPVLIGSLVAGALGSVLLCLAGGLSLLIVGRALQGIAVGAASGAAAGALRETHPRADDGHAAQISSAAMVGGGAIGPLLAGFLVELLPWPRQLSYLVQLGLLVVVAAIILTAYRPVTERAAWRVQLPKVPHEILPRCMMATLAAALAWAVTALFMALVPSLMGETFDIHNAVLTGGMVTVILGASAAMQFVANGWDPHRIQVWGLPAVVVGLILLLIAQGTVSVILLLTSALVAGLGQGLVFLGATKTVNLSAPTRIVGSVTSAYFTGVYLGVGVPVIGVGLLATKIGLVIAVEWFAGFTIVGCAVVLVWLRQGRPDARSQQSSA